MNRNWKNINFTPECIGERIGGFALETIKLKKGPFEILLKIQSKNHFWEIADN